MDADHSLSVRETAAGKKATSWRDNTGEQTCK